MIQKLCIFTIGFAFNRQVLINYLEKVIPKEVELFIFTTKESKGKFLVKRARLFESKKSKYNSFFELRRFCKKNKINRIINLGSLPQEGLIMFFSSLFTRTDFVLNLVGNPIAPFIDISNNKSIKPFFESFILYFLLALPKKTFVCSKDILSIIRRYAFFAKKKLFYLPPTVNTTLFTPKSQTLARKKLKLPLNRKIIIFVGRVEYMKGADIIFELAKENKNFLFLLIGALTYKRFESEKLPNVILIPSANSRQLVDYYNSSDLCLFPSRAESFGLVPREAMACSLPTIVSDIQALRVIEPALKIKISKEDALLKIKELFSLNLKELMKIKQDSRKFIVNECDDNLCKNLYINNILK